MPARPSFLALRAVAPVVLPSLLLCDFADLRGELRALEAAGVRGLHLDVMDGHFVPNFTYGLTIVEAVRKSTELPLDVHLMVERPERLIGQFVAAGADSLTIHVEATADARGVLAAIRREGAAAGLALNPDTPLDAVRPLLDACDLVLVMSVQPGYGGQPFEPVALEKLKALREETAGRIPLEVDGGVNEQTIRACAEAGAEFFVAGSAIFRTPDYSRSVAALAARARTT